MKNPANCKLPKKLSKLAALALEDLKKVERSRRYVVDMGAWHEPADENDGLCYVCFAGAVMAKTCKLDRNATEEAMLGGPESSKFQALNYLRTGNVEMAYRAMHGNGLPFDDNELVRAASLDRTVPPYVGVDEDKRGNRAWHEAMRVLVADLKLSGL